MVASRDIVGAEEVGGPALPAPCHEAAERRAELLVRVGDAQHERAAALGAQRARAGVRDDQRDAHLVRGVAQRQRLGRSGRPDDRVDAIDLHQPREALDGAAAPALRVLDMDADRPVRHAPVGLVEREREAVRDLLRGPRERAAHRQQQAYAQGLGGARRERGRAERGATEARAQDAPATARDRHPPGPRVAQPRGSTGRPTKRCSPERSTMTSTLRRLAARASCTLATTCCG